MNALLSAAREALKQSGLWQHGSRLLCAVSGGCDSVALLHALHLLQKEMPFALFAVHVQHGLRGEDSAKDEQFVRNLCARLKISLTVENAGLSGNMHTPGMETLARERRRAIFERLLASLPAHALLTAHHQDDQAETVLMHLLRGSGLKGLCAMPLSAPFGGGQIVRPFLTLPKQQLRDALLSAQLPFREDGSNQEAVTPRNALRLTVLPQLETLFPGAGAHMAQTALTLQADEACLSAEAERLYQAARFAHPPLFMLKAAPLADAPEAIRRRAVRLWYRDALTEAGLAPDERSLSHTDTLAMAALVFQPEGTRLNLPCGLMAACERDWLHLAFQNGNALRPADFPPEIITPERAAYALGPAAFSAAPAASVPQDASSAVFTPALLSRKPVLRTPKPQDVIRPLGAPGSKPLRRWLTDQKVDPFLRACLPVVCAENEVLWIPGLCISETLRLSSVPPGSIQLTITDQPPFPKPPKE